MAGEESQIDDKTRELKGREELVSEKEKLLQERQDKVSSLETEVSSLRVCVPLTAFHSNFLLVQTSLCRFEEYQTDCFFFFPLMFRKRVHQMMWNCWEKLKHELMN